MEKLLALEMVHVTETAAIACARFMGRGEMDEADRPATEAMRATMDEIEIAGTIVIGEGERDEAPMLYIGEQVGLAGRDRDDVPEIDIAVDPLEGTNLVAHGRPTPSPSSPRPRRAASSTRPTRTSRSSASGRSPRARSTSARRRPRTSAASPRRSAGDAATSRSSSSTGRATTS